MLKRFHAWRGALGIAGVGIATLASGCSKDDPSSELGTQDDAPTSGCTQGDTRECVGPGACKGGQLCDTDGKWGGCECGPTQASVPSSTSGQEELPEAGLPLVAGGAESGAPATAAGTDPSDTPPEMPPDGPGDVPIPPLGSTDTGSDAGALRQAEALMLAAEGADELLPLPDAALRALSLGVEEPFAIPVTGDIAAMAQHPNANVAVRVFSRSHLAAPAAADELGDSVFYQPSESKVCARGTALTAKNYDRTGRPGLTIYLISPNEPPLDAPPPDEIFYWDSAASGVAGFQFDLETAPATGVYVTVMSYPTAEEAELGTFEYDAQLPADFGPIHDGERQLHFSPICEGRACHVRNPNRIIGIYFVVHTGDLEVANTNPVEFDFCVSNIRPLVALSTLGQL
jgi:hypothetical protein